MRTRRVLKTVFLLQKDKEGGLTTYSAHYSTVCDITAVQVRSLLLCKQHMSTPGGTCSPSSTKALCVSSSACVHVDFEQHRAPLCLYLPAVQR